MNSLFAVLLLAACLALASAQYYGGLGYGYGGYSGYSGLGYGSNYYGGYGAYPSYGGYYGGGLAYYKK